MSTTTSGPEFLDWLHEHRRKTEQERKRRGLTHAEQLRETAVEARRVMAEVNDRRAVVVRDKPRKQDK